MTRMTRPVHKTGAEQDTFSSWRRFCRWRPGEIKQVKRRANKRDRKAARHRITREED